MRTIPIALTLLLGACSGLSGDTRPAFEQVAFNSPWYGAYHRPIPDGDAAPRERAERERAPREPRERERREPEPRVDTAAAPAPPSPPPTQAAAVAIPDAVVDGYDQQLAAAYVRDVYVLNETPIGAGPMNVVEVYRWAQEHGQIYHTPRPAVGDLVFFHNTHDGNADGRPNDWYSHVGIVEAVDSADTVTVLSYVGGNVGRVYMNRRTPGDVRVGDDTVNTELRARRRGDPEHTQYTAGHLFAGFASLLGERTQVVVLDVWQPADSPSLQATR